MIRRISVSETDRSNLSTVKTVQESDNNSINYAKLVVNKPWGYEYLMFENDLVAIWILHLRKGYATSMHCHPRKKTSLVVISGKVLVYTLTQWFELSELEGLILEEGVFHSTKASADQTMIMEIETPVNKKDLVRLKDTYGREHKGYEGDSQFSKNLRNYTYIFFNDIQTKKQAKKRIHNTYISIKICKSNYLHEEIDLDGGKIYSILEEKVVDAVHESLLGVGNIFDAQLIGNNREIRLFKNCLLLTLERRQ